MCKLPICGFDLHDFILIFKCMELHSLSFSKVSDGKNNKNITITNDKLCSSPLLAERFHPLFTQRSYVILLR